MATIPLTKNANGTWLWETVTGSDVGRGLKLPSGGAQVAVYVTGTFGDTLTMQGTVDGSNWFTLTAGPGGDDVTFASAGYVEVATAVHSIRPSAGASITDVDVSVSLVV